MLSRLFITLSNISEEICTRLCTVEEHLTGLQRELVTDTHAESALYTVPLSHGDLFPSRSDLDLHHCGKLVNRTFFNGCPNVNLCMDVVQSINSFHVSFVWVRKIKKNHH